MLSKVDYLTLIKTWIRKEIRKEIEAEKSYLIKQIEVKKLVYKGG